MRRNNGRQQRGSRKSSLSSGGSYSEIGEFWDQHDLSDFWEDTRAARVDVRLESEESLYAIEKSLSQTIQRAAKERGVSPHTLVNLWLQEKLREIGQQ